MGDEIARITEELKDKYPDVGIRSIEVDSSKGTSTFYLDPTRKSLAFLDKPGQAITPHIYRDKAAAVVTRDFVERTVLDLAQKDPFTEDPKESFKRATKYYYTEPIVGTTINLLAGLAAAGFENDIDDPNIKNFFDVWAFDVNLMQVLEWIFLDFFRTGHVTTYKVLAKYEPRVSNLSPIPGQTPKKVSNKATGKMDELMIRHEKEREEVIATVVKAAYANGIKDPDKLKEIELAAKKNIWSKGFMPVAYTVLNPELVTIEGNLLFNNVSVKLRPPNELKDMMGKPTSELTEEEKALIKALPSDLKAAAEAGKDYQLDSRLVGQVTYRKMPYERYARPRTLRLFDSIEYKKNLREADLSTLDGISNYILKITIGNDEYPVVGQEELEAAAQLFNTPSKSFDVVWNHTLQVEKIVSPEIEAILGQDKYAQVNEDISGGLGITRAMIDGTGNTTAAEISLLIKGIGEEISYARREVERWLYREYRQIAEAAGFEKFPKIRWDEGILKDTILWMNTLAQLVDRRMMSYKTALEELGYDYPSELEQMKVEMPLVEDGTFGILGSPWQQAKVQPAQNSPVGTPSSGRPKGQTKKKTPETNPQKKVTNQPGKKPTQNQKKTASIDEDVIKSMSSYELGAFLDGAKSVLDNEDYYSFLETVLRIRT